MINTLKPISELERDGVKGVEILPLILSLLNRPNNSPHLLNHLTNLSGPCPNGGVLIRKINLITVYDIVYVRV